MKLYLSEASVPLSNRGLAYGDGFFETMLFKQGHCALQNYHLARLCNTAQALGMAISKADAMSLMQRLKDDVLDEHGDQIIKLLITREAGGRGYRSLEQADAEVFIQAFEFPGGISEACLTAGVVLRVCDIRLAIQPALAGLKHLNRIENVLARNEWRDEDIYEGLLLDQNGLIVEATQSNIFFKIGGRWLTPELNLCGVAGVMRAWLLDHQESLSQRMHVTTLSMDDLSKATACFICNSVQGIVPVQSIHNKDDKISFDLDASLQLLEQVKSVLG
jgi:4-amino-4-deoxychorismate lyase